MGMTFIVSDM